jgi:hypothetical protein
MKDPDPRIALLVIGDGRDALRAQAMKTFYREASGFIIQALCPVNDRHHERGFAGSIQEGWQVLQGFDPTFDYVFHIEEDFEFLRPFSIAYMAQILDQDPRLAQVALRRNAVNKPEREAGGVVELNPNAYTEQTTWWANEVGPIHYLEHSLYFTTNPCLYRRELMEQGWPSGSESEGRFTQKLREQGMRFALLGARTSGVWVQHHGKRDRASWGY